MCARHVHAHIPCNAHAWRSTIQFNCAAPSRLVLALEALQCCPVAGQQTPYRQIGGGSWGLTLQGSGFGCGLGLESELLVNPSQLMIFVRHSGPDPV